MSRALVLTATLLLTSAAAAFAAEPIDFSAAGARTFRALPGKAALTTRSAAAPATVAMGFLTVRLAAGESLGTLELVREERIAHTGLTHVRLEQTFEGLEVYGTYAKGTINDRGELVHLIENLATTSGGLLPAMIDGPRAAAIAIQAHYPTLQVRLGRGSRAGASTSFDKAGAFSRSPTATRVAIPMVDGSMAEGFLVETWSDRDNLLHHTLVGGDGEILRVELRTNTDSYNIFPDHPGNSSQTVVAGAGAGNAQSPGGWLGTGGQSTVDISGNNAHAYLDRNNDNASDGGGSPVSDGNFLTAANLGQEPTTTQNQAVAVQNLFYLNNVIHDKLYRHGFTESAGNFQQNNFGQGGAGNDPVDAEAQDGGSTNNANFSTPADGSRPRMQMYLWTRTSPQRDGDVDSDIVWHEYGHGLTWRMIGNMSGPLSGAIGEGMSDVLSVLINGDDVVGEYSFNSPNGIRSAPYTNYPRTYGDFTGSEVHSDGEIYGAIGWRLGEIFQGQTVPMDTLFDYIVGGMNFTPAGPAFEDMRDGILQAAAGSGHECLVWEAFSQFGVGVGAKATVKGGGPFGGGKVTVTESFALPAACSSCIVTENPEVTCNDGADNDCDGLIDALDPDCAGGSCTLGQPGAACTSNAECCSNSCKGKPGSKTCK